MLPEDRERLTPPARVQLDQRKTARDRKQVRVTRVAEDLALGPAAGAVIDGFVMGKCLHSGAMGQLFEVTHEGEAAPLVMKLPRFGIADSNELLLAFETHALIIGEGVTPEMRDRTLAAIRATPGVDEVTQMLTLHLGPDTVLLALKVRFRPTANLAAYDAFLKGEAASQVMSVGDPASLRRAIGYYERAVALDSAFVSAWTQLARARSILYANGTPTPALAAEARRAADRAQTLAPERPEGQLALGMYYVTVAVDNRRALAAFEAGLKLAPTNVDLLVGAALAEQTQGRWDSAREHLARAGALDPRSANTARRTGFNLLFLRRYPEARTALERALALAPNNFVVIEQQAMVALAQGDLTGARAIVRAAATTVGTAAPLAYFATYWDLYWVLDDAQQQQMLALPPSAFDDDRGSWAIVRAQTYALRGNPVQSRVYADSARLAFDEQLRESPEDPQRHAFRGLALAYLGRKAEAIAEGERAARLAPISRNALTGAYLQHQLVRIYLLVDEPEKALDQLEPLLRMPYFLSPGWLRIDPTFAPLKGNPRFERLVAQ